MNSEERKKYFTELVEKEPQNGFCADCNSDGPDWASVNLGLFVCITCSGIHRNLGTHISRVKSLYLDNWTEDDLKAMREGGNSKGLATWERCSPPFYSKPVKDDSVAVKEQFIKTKYERKEFLQPSATIDLNSVPYKDGWLMKRGNGWKTWKRRFFVINGSVVSYYKRQVARNEDEIPCGHIFLNQTTKIDALDATVDNKPCCFIVYTPTREYYISAETGIVMFTWIQTMRQIKYRFCDHAYAQSVPHSIKTETLAPKVFVRRIKLPNGKICKTCFLGIELVDWLVVTFQINRGEAIKVATQYYEKGLIINVAGVGFSDSDQCYQFK